MGGVQELLINLEPGGDLGSGDIGGSHDDWLSCAVSNRRRSYLGIKVELLGQILLFIESLSHHWSLFGRCEVQGTEPGPVLLMGRGVTVNVGVSNKNLTAASLGISPEVLLSPLEGFLYTAESESSPRILETSQA